MKSLGTPQHIMWLTYLDCKKRTKKEIKFPKETKGISHDEELVHFMLENSSITERQGERSYHRVYDAIDVICSNFAPVTGVPARIAKITAVDTHTIAIRHAQQSARSIRFIWRKRNYVKKKRMSSLK